VLDRPISEFDGPVDSVRVPVVPPTGECKPFQEVLIELAGRLKLPAFTTSEGTRKFRDYPDFIVNFQTAPDSGVGFLIGWRGKEGDKALVGEPNPKQWEQYANHNCVFHYTLPETLQYMRGVNGPYLKWAVEHGFRKFDTPIVIQLYSDVMQKFRLAAQGKTAGRQPPDHLRERVERYFDPLPFWYEPLELAATDRARFPLAAVTQRPMAMYHSWDSQNAWLRQIHGENYLFMNPLWRRRTVSKTAAGSMSNRRGARCAAWRVIAKRWSPARCGRGMRSARLRVPGTSAPMPTNRNAASCSTT
jgi:anaerobic selenocysteine-containing dehydrogenase